jgi:hypothetical protein
VVRKKCGFIANCIAPEYTTGHCIICQAIAVTKIPNAPKMVLDKVVNTVNFIEARPFQES